MSEKEKEARRRRRREEKKKVTHPHLVSCTCLFLLEGWTHLEVGRVEEEEEKKKKQKK